MKRRNIFVVQQKSIVIPNFLSKLNAYLNDIHNQIVDFKNLLSDILYSDVLNALCIENGGGFKWKDFYMLIMSNNDSKSLNPELEYKLAKTLFGTLDADGDGIITPDELKVNLANLEIDAIATQMLEKKPALDNAATSVQLQNCRVQTV